MARRAGWQVNNKRIRRLWREEGLQVPQRRKKKRLTGIGVAMGAMSPIRPNVIWAMDFQFDTTADGRTLKMLNVIDEFTREALAIDVDRSLDADGVVEVLDRLALQQQGAPNYVRFDNGRSFPWRRTPVGQFQQFLDAYPRVTQHLDRGPGPKRAVFGLTQVYTPSSVIGCGDVVRHCHVEELPRLDGSILVVGITEPSYKGHRYPSKIIDHCVWLYFRFTLSLRDIEELMLERGVVVSYETVRRWCPKFGQAYANRLRHRRARPGDTWHLDEVFVRINGDLSYLWRAVDQDGVVLDMLVQSAKR